MLAKAPHGQTVQNVDFFAHAHHSIAEAMLTVIMGEVSKPNDGAGRIFLISFSRSNT